MRDLERGRRALRHCTGLRVKSSRWLKEFVENDVSLGAEGALGTLDSVLLAERHMLRTPQKAIA